MDRTEPPDLLETMLWKPEHSYVLGDRHLTRLLQSAAQLGYAVSGDRLAAALHNASQQFLPHPQRVHLVVSPDGTPTVTAQPLTPLPQPYRIPLAIAPVESSNPWLYHKTTQRDVYARAIAATPHYSDVLLWNERGEVTESCIANLVVQIEGRFWTPPVSCGLLPGIYRQWLLEQGTLHPHVLAVEQLAHAQGLWLVNSVRAMWPIELVGL
ncbi:MAG: aminotransferase class IV [Kaiparowitsia implicata GSE-PSE-MK54-09C]|jgi:para-aminobenzoate synthetase/4-amino-4-deoxychorismate lyase|nr:aminotransferase class IV [Kaiparowitsia implicata GSE-PSE-MK54-09C]